LIWIKHGGFEARLFWFFSHEVAQAREGQHCVVYTIHSLPYRID
jgi:hypothetical protein